MFGEVLDKVLAEFATTRQIDWAMGRTDKELETLVEAIREQKPGAERELIGGFALIGVGYVLHILALARQEQEMAQALMVPVTSLLEKLKQPNAN